MKKLVVISDLGDGSLHLAMLKAQICSVDLQVDIVELTHQIPLGDKVQAAFFLKNTYSLFPPGTVFYLCVGLPLRGLDKIVITQYENKLIIHPDNGVVHLGFPSLQANHYEVAKGVSLMSLLLGLWEGESYLTGLNKLNQVAARILPQNQHTDSMMQTYILHVDHFGNVYIGLSKTELQEWLQGKSFLLRLRRDEKLSKIHESMADVEGGNVFAVYSENREFIIAGSNMGNGSELMGLKVLDKVIIEKTN